MGKIETVAIFVAAALATEAAVIVTVPPVAVPPAGLVAGAV
jgi:hypothetical protein